jgi:hypothetical protein
LDITNIREKFIIEDTEGYCTKSGSLLVIQVSCNQQEVYMAYKQGVALLLTCIGLFTMLSYFAAINFMLNFSGLHKLEWDMKTITAGDYTVEMKVTEKQFDVFKRD